ncbi:MAG: MFS transporter [Proteobacteria bacterium]|nr:MFS transporter [Pseudomonadota bacterium]MCP4920001.1 MFS transporter [Pseudomonadota bacterium]
MSAARQSLAIGLSIAAMGASYPYLSTELEAAGAGPWLLGGVMVATPTMRLALGNVWGGVSDRAQGATWVLVVAALIAAVGMGLMSWGLLVVGVLFFAFGRVGIDPLLDAAIVRSLADRRVYGKIRSWGSVGFVVAVLAASYTRDLGYSPFLVAAAMSVGLVLVSTALKSAPPAGPPVQILPALKELSRDRTVVLLLFASAFHFAGISIYDGFYALHLDRLGIGSWSGPSFALGVGVEVVALFAGPWLLQRFSATRLIQVGIALSVPRFVLTALITAPIALTAVQALHGLTFGLFWVGAIQLMADRAPRHIQSSGQALLSAAVGGLGALTGMGLGSIGIATLPSSSHIFWIAALLAVFALILSPRTCPEADSD